MFKKDKEEKLKLPEVPEINFQNDDFVHLSEEQAKLLVQLGFNLDKEKPIEESELSREFVPQMLSKRLAAYNLPFSFTDLFLLASMVTWVTNPGKVMILLRMCYQLYKKKGTACFNLDVWCKELFPGGVPSDKALQEYWDSQKHPEAPLGNLLDLEDNWKL